MTAGKIHEYTTTLWEPSHGHDSFADYAAMLAGSDHTELAAVAANTLLNAWCSDVADYSQREADSRETDRRGHGKRLPYVGWYWRSVDFARKRVTVADCSDFIGFCENNKWGYPERSLNNEEADQVIAFLWRARTEGSKGGSLSDLDAARDAVLTELWDWMQTLTDLKGWDQ